MNVGLLCSFMESGLLCPVLLVLFCTVSVSSRAGGGGAHLPVMSGLVHVALFVVGDHCILVAHVCSVGRNQKCVWVVASEGQELLLCHAFTCVS